VKRTYEQLFLGAAGEVVVEVHALATDLATETVRVHLVPFTDKPRDNYL
jgi:hypothetical protein